MRPAVADTRSILSRWNKHADAVIYGLGALLRGLRVMQAICVVPPRASVSACGPHYSSLFTADRHPYHHQITITPSTSYIRAACTSCVFVNHLCAR